MKRLTDKPRTKTTEADSGQHDNPNGPGDSPSLVAACCHPRGGWAPSGSAEGVSSGDNHAYRNDLNPCLVPVEELRPLGRDTRKHANGQLRKIENSLGEYGFVLPVLIDEGKRVIAGWGLVLAAKNLKLDRVPAVVLSDLTEAKSRALRLALNRIGEDASWDKDELRIELDEILCLDAHIELTTTGFENGEIDLLLLGDGSVEEDEVPATAPEELRTSAGDLWILGNHKILCGDALDPGSYARLLGEERAEMILSDPPYNVRIEGNVSGLGAKAHREFVMASGEMSPQEFQGFLGKAFELAVRYAVSGSLHFWFMDWRHLREIAGAGDGVYSELKNVCVWSKTNAGMGSLYRSAHELIFVYKAGKAPHINNVALGKNGRNRTNVWTYAGQTALSGRKNKLSLHPTVKPVGLLADAIRDCSRMNGIILDPFGGAGSVLIAAERTGRCARLIEIDPVYVDVTVKRWEALQKGKAVLIAAAGAEQSATPPASPPTHHVEGVS